MTLNNQKGKMVLNSLMTNLSLSRIEFLKNEYFSESGVDEFLKDKELVKTIEDFLENDLNILKTSKKTFMHRNTLLYRIQKVKKLTSLDVRHFEDALLIQVLLNLNNLYEKSI